MIFCQISPQTLSLVAISVSFPVILVTGLQVAIGILGRGRLDKYVGCLEESLLVSFEVPVNLTSDLPVSY